jgi:hypothetical protein
LVTFLNNFSNSLRYFVKFHLLSFILPYNGIVPKPKPNTTMPHLKANANKY